MVAANWKLNGSLQMAQSLVSAINTHSEQCQGVDVVISPPFPYLVKVAELISSSTVHLGAQSAAQHESGAYTGEVSASMLAEVGCKFVIIGHSERREYYGESDEVVAAKFMQVQRAGLTPILCVGETLEQREQGVMQQTIVKQVNAVVDQAGIEAMLNSVIAYEPIWAIGTGKTASPEEAQEVHAIIRGELAKQSTQIAEQLKVLYGGSVKPDNATELFSQTDIDGGLIGGASLDAEQFNAIVSAAN
jgi:triosephosphate isomerase